MKSLFLFTLPLLASALINNDTGNSTEDNIAIEDVQVFAPTPVQEKAGLQVLPPPLVTTTITPTPVVTVTVAPNAHFPGFINAQLSVFAVAAGGAGILYDTTTGLVITQGNLAPGGTARLVRTTNDAEFFGVLFGDRNIDVFQNTVPPVLSAPLIAHTTAPAKIECVQDFKISSDFIVAVNGRRLAAWNWRTGAPLISDKYIGGSNAYDISENYLVYLQKRCQCGVKTSVLKVIDLRLPSTQHERVIVLGNNTARSVALNNDGTQDQALVGFSDFANLYVLPDALQPPQTYLSRVDYLSACPVLFFSEVPAAVDEVSDTTDQFVIYRHNLTSGVVTAFAVPKDANGGPDGLLWQSLRIYQNNLLVGGLLLNDKTRVYLASATFPPLA